MEKRRMIRLNEEEIYHNAQESAERVLEKSGLKNVAMPEWPII